MNNSIKDILTIIGVSLTLGLTFIPDVVGWIFGTLATFFIGFTFGYVIGIQLQHMYYWIKPRIQYRRFN